MLPPAPVRFSMMMDWPRISDIFSATTRATTPVPPPAENDTTRWIGRAGNSCASELAQTSMAAMTKARRERMVNFQGCEFFSIGDLRDLVWVNVGETVKESFGRLREITSAKRGRGDSSRTGALASSGGA